MIDFACKRFELDEIIKCGLGLTKSDFKIMMYLLKNNEDMLDSSQIAKRLNLNLSTCQRSLKRLNEKDIIARSQINLSKGGYNYLYRIHDKRFLRKLIMDVINGWTKRVENELKRW